MPVASLALFLLALYSGRGPVPATPAAADLSAMVESDPDFTTLSLTREHFLKPSLLDSSGSIYNPHSPFISDILVSEWEMFHLGAEHRRATLLGIFQEITIDNTRWWFAARRQEYAKKRTALAKDAEKELDETYEHVNSLEGYNFLSREKHQLLNLRLKMRVLTLDGFVMPERRANSIKLQIAQIERMIDSAEREFNREHREEFSHESRKIQSDFRKALRQLEEQLSGEIQTAIESAEKDMQAIIEDVNRDTADIVARGASTRKQLYSSGPVEAAPGAPQNAATPSLDEDLAIMHVMLMKEFMRRARRKAPAVAERRGLGLILDTPYPSAGAAADVTGDFN